eukprot:PLAT15939.1.p1 GENE.PLAT15939.1~~PLAT15939.1.p1  ORF type:complete len:489 (+),score=248.38 PLAT15939.1:562-2028(+)
MSDSSHNLAVKRSQLPERWLVLILACFILVGSYYSYDNPAATVDLMKQYFNVSLNTVSPTEAQKHKQDLFDLNFNLLYSLYSIPNVVLPFFGGYFVDKLGVRMMLIVFTTPVTLGQAVVALGLQMKSWYVMWAGRTLFGLGAESLSVGISTLTAQWFIGKELAMAMGLTLALARLGSVVNDYISSLFPVDRVYFAFWVGFAICVLSSVCSWIVACIDRRAEAKLARNRLEGSLNPDRGASKDKEEEEEQDVSLWDARHFGLQFWLLAASCIVVYCSVLPFNNIASDFMLSKYIAPGVSYPSKAQKHEASEYLSITYTVSGVLSPFLGAIIDRVGMRAAMAIVSSSLIAAIHVVLGYTTIWPLAPLFALGVCYSIYASAFWPAIAYVVEKRYLGLAYGLVTAVQNAGLATAPIAVGELLPPHYPSYRAVETMFAGLGALGVVLGIWLNYVDYKNGWVLNSVHLDDQEDDKLKEDDVTTPMLHDVTDEDV